jgi:hypothetical protein
VTFLSQPLKKFHPTAEEKQKLAEKKLDTRGGGAFTVWWTVPFLATAWSLCPGELACLAGWVFFKN